MILVCEKIQERLDNVWDKLQEIELKRHEGISQIDLDTVCVERLERFVRRMEGDADRRLS